MRARLLLQRLIDEGANKFFFSSFGLSVQHLLALDIDDTIIHIIISDLDDLWLLLLDALRRVVSMSDDAARVACDATGIRGALATAMGARDAFRIAHGQLLKALVGDK